MSLHLQAPDCRSLNVEQLYRLCLSLVMTDDGEILVILAVCACQFQLA